MKYHVLAAVHGQACSAPTTVSGAESAAHVVHAVVEGATGRIGKRVVAVIDAAHRLSPEELLRTARQIGEQLQRSFARRGLLLSVPELVSASDLESDPR